MPKDTFFNLAETKRTMIEEASIEEFLEYGFDKASINRIIEKCGIAKGSFYQYFTGKKDVFIHIMDLATKRKMGYMTEIFANPAETDFFVLLKELYLAGLRFAHDNPKLVAIANQLLKNKSHPVYEEILGDGTKKAYEVFEGFINLAISRGEVRADIDVRFISYMISNMNVATIEYYNDEVLEGVTGEEDAYDHMMGTVDLFLDFVQRGISNH